ncbi:unnamed protein product [Urochloa decumbens]|uniref:Ubiquitin carboxyl-terminal hydrolase n=1 Tax=Urochloa decumbens TaxID=240449 RepID=A0ABC9BIF3_9POAL
MGDTRPRGWEAGESSRDAKTPRLDFLAAVASEEMTGRNGRDDLGWEEWPDVTGRNGQEDLGWEEWPDVTGRNGREDLGWEEWPDVSGDNNRCNHVPTDSAHKEILDSSLLSDDAGKCVGCQQEEELANRRILVCLECGRQFCGDSDAYIPYGHAQDHAKQEQHWVAAMFADPQAGFCFKCGTEVPVYPEKEEMPDGIQAGGHAFGFDVQSGLVSGLPNLGDTWHGHEFGSASVQGYAIRGMWNRGSTCYVNAAVQCLLVLDRLRERMLAPDALLGHLGLALMEIFLETSLADDVGSVLNPDRLLRSIRLHADKFEPYKMHDSHELLNSLRDALHSEENEIETPNRQRGAPTVIDSIFRGELSYTRSCIHCGSSQVPHDQVYGLSLSLPSKEHPSRSDTAPQTSTSLKSQPKKVATLLIPANEKSTSERIQSVAKSSDSYLLGSELKDVMEKTPEPLELDSSEAQHIWQSKDVIQVPLQTEDKVSCSKLSQGIIEVPPESVSVVPHNLYNVKVEQLIEITTDSHSPEDMGPPPLVSLSENGAPMASGSCVDQNDNADPGDLMNQLEVSIQTKENTYTVQFTAEDQGNARSRDVVYDKGAEGSNSIPSIEDCLSYFFTEQALERNCDDCPKVLEETSTNQSGNVEQMVASTTNNTAAYGNHTEQSDRLAGQTEQSLESNSLSVECKSSSSRQPDDSDARSEIIQTVEANTEGMNSAMSYGDKEIECHEGVQEAVGCCFPAEKQTNLLGTHHSENLSTPNQDMRKQVELDHGASKLGDNQNEQKQRSGCSIETPRITKLPPVLTLHIKRYIMEGDVHHKNEARVSYKEYLDVGRFMDPSSADKDQSLYRLAGVVEHIGGPSMNSGHYVAYVRARRLGDQQEQSSCSSSWFCADDSSIREVTLEEVLKREAYILFYEQVEG